MRQRGFTLIELVLVIILIGILAVFVLPKWLGSSQEESRTALDELVARLRLVQSMNMNEPQARCSQLVVDTDRFGHQTQAGDCTGEPISSWDQNDQIRGRVVALTVPVTLANQPTFSLHFDRLGRPLAPCAGGCKIMVAEASIQIESEGYVHALP